MHELTCNGCIQGDAMGKKYSSVVAHISKILDKSIQLRMSAYIESHAFLSSDQLLSMRAS